MKNQKHLEAAPTPFMVLAPNPVAMESPLRGEEDIAQHRRLYCAHYGGCLDQSVRKGWAGFTCLHCPLRDYASLGPRSEAFARQCRDAPGE